MIQVLLVAGVATRWSHWLSAEDEFIFQLGRVLSNSPPVAWQKENCAAFADAAVEPDSQSGGNSAFEGLGLSGAMPPFRPKGMLGFGKTACLAGRYQANWMNLPIEHENEIQFTIKLSTVGHQPSVILQSTLHGWGRTGYGWSVPD